MKKQLKVLFLSVSLLAVSSCSILINTEDNLKKLNEQLDIENYETLKEDSYSITYVLNGGTNNPDNPTKYSSNDGTIKLKDPERIGYTFMGWYLDSRFYSKITEIKTSTQKDYTLYAKWKLVEYSITYNLDGGINNSLNPSKYTYEDSITFYDPSKEDYQFVGWYTDSNFSKSITGIETNSSGDISIYAKWIKKTESIIVFNSDSENIQLNIENIYGTNITLRATEGFTSYKWYYDEIMLTETSNQITINIDEPGYHYITVQVYDDSGLYYSASCIIRRKDTQSSSSIEESSDDEPNTIISLNPLVNNCGSILIAQSNNNGSIIFTATAGFNDYKWIVDEVIQTSSTNILTINTLTPGYHIITVTAQVSTNKYVSNYMKIRVTE